MEIAFIYDHRFFCEGKSVFSEVGFSSSFWNRYLAYCNQLKVVGRNGTEEKGHERSKMIRSDNSRVEFILLPSLSSIKGQMCNKKVVKDKLLEVIKASDFIIVRIPSEMGLLALKIANKERKKCLVEVVGCPFDSLWNYGTIKSKMYAPILYYRTKKAISREKYVTYVTEKFLQKRYPARDNAIISACSDVEIENCPQEIIKERINKNNDKDRKIKMGLIGSLRTRAKGIQTVLDALVLIQGEIADVEFHVLGGGPKEEWQNQINRKGLKKIAFLDGGLPSGSPVLQWLDGIDIYLQPSFQEGLPRALIEAMSRGCPAIGSTAGGIPELLEPDCLINPGDTEGLSRLLLKAIKDVEWRNRQSERNLAKAKAYSKDMLNSRQKEFMEKVLRPFDIAPHIQKATNKTS